MLPVYNVRLNASLLTRYSTQPLDALVKSEKGLANVVRAQMERKHEQSANTGCPEIDESRQ